jgi:hypothetical protein
MLVSDAMNRINYALRGLDDSAPTESSEEWTYWLSILNRKKDELYRDAKQNWSDIWAVNSPGTISANAAPSFDLDDTFIGPSDSIYCIDSDGHRTDFTLVPPQERNPLIRQVYVAGNNPKVLYFSNAITSTETIVGATLYVPGYYLPDDVTSNGEDLPFSDPDWVVIATAAEIAFNDLVYEDKAPDLQNKANQLWQQMTNTNRVNTFGNSRKIPTNVNRIRKASRH